MNKKAIIIGAGPAGLTAAYELLHRTDITPIVLEKTNDIGGLSKTVNYKGNRIDIGGHRFFSKSELVMKWWQNILPIEDQPEILNTATDSSEKKMLIRSRVSHIYFLKKLFDYPVKLNLTTVKNLGAYRIVKIIYSYLLARIKPARQIITLEDFFITRFGYELYKTFFKDYTEKVWGVPCSKIPAEWGAQRIKNLSITETIVHAVKAILKKDKSIEQSKTNTSLIEQFLYPKFGPGQMWETVAEIIEKKGGTIIKNADVLKINSNNQLITELVYKDQHNEEVTLTGDYFFSTMPVKELTVAMSHYAPEDVVTTGSNLQYRDFITVGLLLNKLQLITAKTNSENSNLIPDNWIYIQESEVKLGRLQIFNNWSPFMIADPTKVWLGLEYFCNEGDELWNMDDDKFIQFAIKELEAIKIINSTDVLDSTIIRMPKAYPAYFGSYNQFDLIKKFTDNFPNLFLIGRNGMHKYNNQDHSMLTAITAVNNIITGEINKENIWKVNTEQEYHEESKD